MENGNTRSVRAPYDPPEHKSRGPLTDPRYTTEFSEFFVDGMRVRMAVSRDRYGLVADAYPNKVNALESLQLRLKKYEETGNAEYLIDAANFAMIEFMYPAHHSAHFVGTDSDGSPGRIERVSGEPVPFENRDIFC